MRSSPGSDSHHAAHPRWRGAHLYTVAGAAAAVGSSPLARGTYLMICIYSKTVLILHLTQNKRHGYSYVTYRYLRRRRAVAHPLRGLLLVVLLSGRIMRVMPSKSVGDPIMIVSAEFHVLLIIRGKDQQCPSISTQLSGWFQSKSRILPPGFPTKTPGAISSTHFVRSPRNPAGHAVMTSTIMMLSVPHNLRQLEQLEVHPIKTGLHNLCSILQGYS